MKKPFQKPRGLSKKQKFGGGIKTGEKSEYEKGISTLLVNGIGYIWMTYNTNCFVPKIDLQFMYISVVTQGDLCLWQHKGKKKITTRIRHFLIFQIFAYSHLLKKMLFFYYEILRNNGLSISLFFSSLLFSKLVDCVYLHSVASQQQQHRPGTM